MDRNRTAVNRCLFKLHEFSTTFLVLSFSKKTELDLVGDSKGVEVTVSVMHGSALNRPAFDAAVFREKDSNHAQEISRRSP